ncbi:hypothetical protein [Desulfobacter vibrioformis]|uniref:hypothetical protein n=1 Tax=Desulfobacter vibrioformis TaxID=34031 RepID=UPI0005520048|nr:hypothetical protein [Desulfobacter vibrioformis]
MHLNSGRYFSGKAICQALISNRLISSNQAKDLLSREREIKEKLVAQTSGNTTENRQRAFSAISFIDVLVHLNLNRLDKPDKVIDEDLIFKTLADSWHLPYKKILAITDLGVRACNLPMMPMSASFGASFHDSWICLATLPDFSIHRDFLSFLGCMEQNCG